MKPIIDFTPYLYPGEKLLPIYNIPELVDIKQCYYLTSKGRVFSTALMRRGVPLEMSIYVAKGYRIIKLSTENTVTKTFRLDRLVLYYFGGPIPSNVKELEANHIDGNKLNDDITNLEWVTHTENMIHAGKMGLMGNELTSDIVSNIIDDLKLNKYTLVEIANKYNTTEAIVYNIKANKSYRYIRPEEREELKASCNKQLTRTDIINIYNQSKIHIDDEYLAKKYNVSTNVIGAIRRIQYPYDVYLEGMVPILSSNVKCDDETALKIYNDCKEAKLSIGQIAVKYNVGKSLVNDIKFLRYSYAYLKDKYNIEPVEYTHEAKKPMSNEIIMKIKNGFMQGKTVKEMAEQYGYSERTVYRVKKGYIQCRNQNQ